MAGLEGEIGKLLAAARAVQAQYSIRPLADSQQRGGEVEQAAGGGGQEAPPGGDDVAMKEAGQL